MRGSVLRVKLLEILKGELWINSLQICRVLNGASGKHDLGFCRDSPHAYSYENNYTGYGGNPYINCKTCEVIQTGPKSAINFEIKI